MSTASSVKLTIKDILAKNPQFGIFHKTESTKQVPPTMTPPSDFASLFKPMNNQQNPFLLSQQLKIQHQIQQID
jgi:hypothetical protein